MFKRFKNLCFFFFLINYYLIFCFMVYCNSIGFFELFSYIMWLKFIGRLILVWSYEDYLGSIRKWLIVDWNCYFIFFIIEWFESVIIFLMWLVMWFGFEFYFCWILNFYFDFIDFLEVFFFIWINCYDVKVFCFFGFRFFWVMLF